MGYLYLLYLYQTKACRNSETETALYSLQVGENLMTFAIIPSRHDIDRPHQQTAATTPRTHSATASSSCHPSPPGRRRLHIIDHYRAMASFGVPDAWLPENLSSSSLSSDDEDRGGPSAGFRLSFDQPAADPAAFQIRLDAQMVCLENVKVCVIKSVVSVWVFFLKLGGGLLHVATAGLRR